MMFFNIRKLTLTDELRTPLQTMQLHDCVRPMNRQNLGGSKWRIKWTKQWHNTSYARNMMPASQTMKAETRLTVFNERLKLLA